MVFPGSLSDSGLSLLVITFLSLLVSLPNLSRSLRVHLLQLVSPSPSRSKVILSDKIYVDIYIFSFFYRFYSVVHWYRTVYYSAGSRFLLTTTWSGRLAEVRWLFVSQNSRELCLILQDRYWFVHIPLSHVVSFFFFCQTPSGSPSPPRHVFSLFYFKLMHSLIMWLIISFLSPHYLHLHFYCILFIFALTYLVLMALFCATIRKIQFLSEDFLFWAMSKPSWVRFRLFVAWNIHTFFLLFLFSILCAASPKCD